MPKAIQFWVPGAPKPKGRPRVVRDEAGRVRTFTPDETKAYEAAVRFAYQRALMNSAPGAKLGLCVKMTAPGLTPRGRRRTRWEWRVLPYFNDGPLGVDLTFYMPDARPVDCDNLGKAVLDACNVAAWRDDSQIVRLLIEKRFAVAGDEPGVRVHISEGAL